MSNLVWIIYHAVSSSASSFKAASAGKIGTLSFPVLEWCFGCISAVLFVSSLSIAAYSAERYTSQLQGK
jgi:hypothetical protein